MNSASALALLTAFVLATPLTAQQSRVDYDVSLPRAEVHEARVTETFRGIPAGVLLHLRMSCSSPGRYAIHSFAKNVYDVSAVDGHGRPLGSR